jgi:hypothetical protein
MPIGLLARCTGSARLLTADDDSLLDDTAPLGRAFRKTVLILTPCASGTEAACIACGLRAKR